MRAGSPIARSAGRIRCGSPGRPMPRWCSRNEKRMSAGRAALGGLGARLAVWLPYAWLVVFFLVPFLIVLKISLSQTAIALPPYVPALDLSAGWDGIKTFLAGLGLDNYATLFSDEIYGLSYLKSLKIAAVSTAILLAIGYPLA